MKRADLLLTSDRADRLHYATGELLGADDFRAEQTYHRRQLARTLLHLHGSGVVAGLRVAVRHRPGTTGVPDEVEMQVHPGFAIDHLGRPIEVPREACLRLRRWFEFIAARAPSSTEPDAGDLRVAWRADAGIPAGGAVVADVFLAFHECPRGYTPAFASGPFDALDASTPSRIRDGYELTLVLRTEADADLPRASDPWESVTGGTLAARLEAAQARAAELWHRQSQPAPENPAGVDQAAVLLARLRLPAAPSASAATAPIPDWSAATWPDEDSHVDNSVRHVLLPPAAIQRLIAP